MKKILFMVATFVGLSFAACGNQTQAGGANDSDTVSVDTVIVVDSSVVDTVVAE